MAYDPLLTRGLVKVHATYREKHPVSNFLRDFFFGNAPVISTLRYVTIEVERDGQKVSTSIRRGSNPEQLLATDDYKRSIYEPPYFSDSSSITMQDLENLEIGESAENPYDSTTKALMVLARKQSNIEARHERTKELQAASVLLNGTVTMVDGSTIAYGQAATLLGVNPAVKWDTSGGTGVDILGNLQTWALLIFAASGVMPNSIVITPDVHKLMINDTAVKAAMDTRNFALGTITAVALKNYPGVADGGMIMVPGVGAMKIYTYANKYDNNGSKTDVLAAGTLIMANSNNMGRFLYAACEGAVNGMPAYIPGESYVSVEKADRMPPVTSVNVQMAPLAAPISLDTWLSANVLVNASS